MIEVVQLVGGIQFHEIHRHPFWVTVLNCIQWPKKVSFITRRRFAILTARGVPQGSDDDGGGWSEQVRDVPWGREEKAQIGKIMLQII